MAGRVRELVWRAHSSLVMLDLDRILWTGTTAGVFATWRDHIDWSSFWPTTCARRGVKLGDQRRWKAIRY